MSWSERGARKFPANVTILRNLYRAYILTGALDSGLAVTQRLLAHDTTAVKPALDLMSTYAFELGVTPRRISFDEMFDDTTRALQA